MPALDGLRAVGIVAVMIYHLNLPRLGSGGWGGVDVFFVLSGFLITSLLISEWDNHQCSVSLRNFYARRALRLFPALACFIVATVGLVVLAELVGGSKGRKLDQETFAAIPWVIFYLGNFVPTFGIGSGTLGWMQHTWSLAIEEQFYSTWPALFILLARRGFRRDRIAQSLAFIALTEMIYSQVMASTGCYNNDRIYYGTDTHSAGLIIGCALGFWVSSRESAQLRLSAAMVLRAVTWIATIALLIVFVFASSKTPYEIAAATLASGLILVGLVTGAAPLVLDNLLSSKTVVWIGRRSYGLYLWHYVIYRSVWTVYGHYVSASTAPGLRADNIGFDMVDIAAVVASFIVAAASYRFIESPFLHLKSGLATKRRGEHRLSRTAETTRLTPISSPRSPDGRVAPAGPLEVKRRWRP
jgi:peptidoglycan/LPS O-acetylase OafA/YrhL